MSNKSFSICFSEKPPKNANILWLRYIDDKYSLYIFNEDNWEVLCSQDLLQETLRMLKRLYRAGVINIREEVEIQLNEKLQNLIIDVDHINYPALDKSLSELLYEFYTTLQNLHPVAFSGYYTDLSKRENVVEKTDLDSISNINILSIWNLSHI